MCACVWCVCLCSSLYVVCVWFFKCACGVCVGWCVWVKVCVSEVCFVGDGGWVCVCGVCGVFVGV